MTYREYEDSVALGQPIELYDLFDAADNHWRFNTSSEGIVYGGYSYAGALVERSKIQIGGDLERHSTELKLPYGHPFATQYITGPLDYAVAVIMYRQHVDTYAVFWRGNLVSLFFNDMAVPVCVFEPMTSSSVRLGHRRRAQLSCNHVIYDNLCQLSMGAWEKVGTISGTADGGKVLQSDMFDTEEDGYFTSGLVKIGNIYRFVLGHTDNTVQISRPYDSVSIGTIVYGYPGCDLVSDTCHVKFDNILNFGGEEDLPVSNPFEVGVQLN